MRAPADAPIAVNNRVSWEADDGPYPGCFSYYEGLVLELRGDEALVALADEFGPVEEGEWLKLRWLTRIPDPHE